MKSVVRRGTKKQRVRTSCRYTTGSRYYDGRYTDGGTVQREWVATGTRYQVPGSKQPWSRSYNSRALSSERAPYNKKTVPNQTTMMIMLCSS